MDADRAARSGRDPPALLRNAHGRLPGTADGAPRLRRRRLRRSGSRTDSRARGARGAQVQELLHLARGHGEAETLGTVPVLLADDPDDVPVRALTIGPPEFPGLIEASVWSSTTPSMRRYALTIPRSPWPPDRPASRRRRPPRRDPPRSRTARTRARS